MHAERALSVQVSTANELLAGIVWYPTLQRHVRPRAGRLRNVVATPDHFTRPPEHCTPK